MLGESWVININLQWEMTRYTNAMIFNTKVEKRAQMITPEKLFKLPQDIYLEKGKPKSTKEQYQEFLNRINKTNTNN